MTNFEIEVIATECINDSSASVDCLGVSSIVIDRYFKKRGWLEDQRDAVLQKALKKLSAYGLIKRYKLKNAAGDILGNVYAFEEPCALKIGLKTFVGTLDYTVEFEYALI